MFPLTVNVNAAPPAVAESGLRETIAGTGFWGGGPTPELPDPPPQPVKKTRTKRDTNVTRRRKLQKGAVLGIDFNHPKLLDNAAFYTIDRTHQSEKSPVRIINVVGNERVGGTDWR